MIIRVFARGFAAAYLVVTPVLAKPRSGPAEGSPCAALARKAPADRLWIGTIIDPGDEDDGGDDADDEADNDGFRLDPDDGDRLTACFRSKADCERWFYRMKPGETEAGPGSGCAPLAPRPSRGVRAG